MEFLFELIFDLMLEGTHSKKLPKFIRIILLSFVSLVFIFVAFLIFYLAQMVLKENIIFGFIVLLISNFFLFIMVEHTKNVIYSIKTAQKTSNKLSPIKPIIFSLIPTFIYIPVYFLISNLSYTDNNILKTIICLMISIILCIPYYIFVKVKSNN